jgi:hypothetical protein
VLIEPGSPWPPRAHATMRDRWLGWRALWAGDLRWLKANLPVLAPGGYWARRAQKPGREVHVPLAADIARTSATLVAGDAPTLKWEDDQAAQTVWNELADDLGWANLLREAFEVASATGGAFLRPAWDEDVADHPLGDAVPADEGFGEWRFGRLRAVTFALELPAPSGWKQIEKSEVWRHLEHHEPGQIRHELWLGNETNVGNPRPLAEHPATANLPGVIDTSSIRPRRILCEYFPNALPNPLISLPMGRSDLQGVEGLMDMLDETVDSWMRDIQLGKGRILASREAMDSVPAGGASGGGGIFKRRGTTTPARAFDTDAEVFEWMDIPGETSEGKPMPFTLVQFLIRFKEHEATALFWIEQIVSRAGYAPQTFGLNVDGQLSGTAMKRRDIRSHQTKDMKRGYAKNPIERFAETLMLIGKAKFSKAAPKKRPVLEWKESNADPLENAQVIELLARARVGSLKVLVAMAHPDWDTDQVDEEVKELLKEREAEMAPVLTGFEGGSFGGDKKPPADNDKPPAAAPKPATAKE